MKRIIALILSLTMVFSLMIVPTVSVNAENTVVKKVDFNDLNSSDLETFKKTLVAGGGYSVSGVNIDSSIKYGASGNSLKMGGIAKKDQRIKFTGLLGKDTLTSADKGKKFTISAYVYSPKATFVYMGLYGATGTANAYSATAESNTEVPANAWTLVQLGFEITDDIIANNTTQVGFEQKKSKDFSDVIYIDEIVVTEGSIPANAVPSTPSTPATSIPATPSADSNEGSILKTLNFDSWESIDNSNFMSGGSYSLSGLSLSTEYDHTSGEGKSLCIGNRTGSGRLKFVDMFNKDGVGTTFNISAWVYSEKAANVLIGVYSTQGTDYATKPIKSVKVEVPANQWTLLALEYDHQNALLTQLGIEPDVDTVYVDDVAIVPDGMELPSGDDLALGNAPEESKKYIKLFSSLGLLQKFIADFDAEATMKRDNFASVLADFLPNIVAETADTKFSDVTSNNPHSGAIKALSDLGVLKGDSNGNFNPSAEIASEEVVAALVSYLGYEVYALGYGGYPSGYITTASKMGLTENVAITVGKPMTQAELLKMMYNFIKIDVLEETQFGDTTKYSSVEGKTILAKNLDIYYNEGKVYGTPVTMLSTASGVGVDRVQIEDTVLKTTDNYNDYLGYQVEYFYDNSNKNLPELLYASPVEGLNEVITVLPADIVGDNDPLRWYYYDSETGKKKSIKYDGSQNMIYNGVYKTFDTELMSIDEGNIRFLDSDCDGIYETVFVNEIYYIVVSAVDKTNEKIFDKYDPLKTIDFDSSDKDNPVRIFNASGKEISIDDLKEWDVLSVKKSDGVNTVIDAVMSRKTVKGTVTGIIKDDDGRLKSIKINDKYYDVSETFKDMFTEYDEEDNIILEPTLNSNVVLYLGNLGTVVTYDADTSLAGKLGYLVDVNVPEGSREKMQMTILEQNKKLVTYTIADKVYMNGSNTSVAYRVFKTYDIFYDHETFEPERQIVMFNTNADGEINKIWYDTGDEACATEENQFYLTLQAASGSNKVYCSGGTNKILYKGANTSLQENENWMLSDNAVVFILPPSSSKDDELEYYTVGTLSSIPDEETGTSQFTGYSLSDDKSIIDVVVRRDGDGISSSRSILVVNDVTTGINDEEEDILIVTGLMDGEEKTIEILDERTDKTTYELTPGDIISYTTDSQGKTRFFTTSNSRKYECTYVRMISDYKPTTNKTFGSFKTTHTNYNYRVTTRGRTVMTYAIPYKYEDGILQFHPYNMTTKPTGDSLPSTPNIQLYRPEVFKNVYVFDTTTNQFRLGSANEIVTATLDPVNYTPIYMYAYENKYQALVIYK